MRIRGICFGIVSRPRFRLTETRRIKCGWRRLVIPSFSDELVKHLLADAEIIGLPSTSPAHAALSPAAKIDVWHAALSKV
jgi:hypothetical protein